MSNDHTSDHLWDTFHICDELDSQILDSEWNSMCVFRPAAPPQEGHQSAGVAEKRNRKQWQVREDVGMVLERVVIMDTF